MTKKTAPKLDAETEKTKVKAEETYQDLKHKAEGIYAEGKHAVCEAHDNLQAYSEELVKHVKEKPLSSLLIAGGIGFILASVFRK